MKTLLTVAAVAATVLAAGAASAQPRGQGQGQGGPGPAGSPGPAAPAGPSITLYDLPNFQGAARTYTAGVSNLAAIGLNDRAQSARVVGRWQICEDANFRGRCVELAGDAPNLAALRMTAAISSFQSLDRPQNDAGRGGFNGGAIGPRGPAPDDRGFGDRGGGLDRAFAGPVLDGRSASFFPRPAPGPYRTAAEFCRRLGFSGVIYADDRGFEIRDVVCRR
ncbi:MAG TPA: beta/gamma crystallin-related protein [Caulobacteraceae bacterium]|nr:beta/gamma crystallin-related protein [Caulobacteraceae bacterium]